MHHRRGLSPLLQTAGFPSEPRRLTSTCTAHTPCRLLCRRHGAVSVPWLLWRTLQRSLVFPNGEVCLLGFTPPLGAASTSRLCPGDPGSSVPTTHLRWAPLSDCGPPGLQLLTEENKRPLPSRLRGLSPSSGPCFLLLQRKKRFCSSSALELGFQGPLHTCPVSVVNYEGCE